MTIFQQRPVAIFNKFGSFLLKWLILISSEIRYLFFYLFRAKLELQNTELNFQSIFVQLPINLNSYQSRWWRQSHAVFEGHVYIRVKKNKMWILNCALKCYVIFFCIKVFSLETHNLILGHLVDRSYFPSSVVVRSLPVRIHLISLNTNCGSPSLRREA